MNNRNQNVNFQVKDGQFVISIGLDSLKRSIELDTNLVMSDLEKAVFAIKGVISYEEENGRTPFHSMLAEAAYQAYADGEEGFEELDTRVFRSETN